MARAREQSELKPCPFCGEKAHLTTWARAENDLLYMVECDNERCPIQPMTAYHKIKDVIVDEWNRRAGDA